MRALDFAVTECPPPIVITVEVRRGDDPRTAYGAGGNQPTAACVSIGLVAMPEAMKVLLHLAVDPSEAVLQYPYSLRIFV